MPETLLKASGLERIFGQGQAAVRAVRGIDFSVARGERVLIMGPSGSGKTTLVSMLGALLTPSAGRVELDGVDLYEMSETERAHLRLKRLGFIFQSFNLLSALSAQENIEVPLRLSGSSASEARARASELLKRLGLAERGGHRPRDLSGGEKQRVAIARALANQPEVVLADEPTANLDSETGREVAETLSALATEEQKGVIIVSYDQRLVETASRVVWIEDGKLSERPGPCPGHRL